MKSLFPTSLFAGAPLTVARIAGLLALGLVLWVTPASAVTANGPGGLSVTGSYTATPLTATDSNGLAELKILSSFTTTPEVGGSYYDYASFGVDVSDSKGNVIYAAGNGTKVLTGAFGTVIHIHEAAECGFNNYPYGTTAYVYGRSEDTVDYTFQDPRFSEKGGFGPVRSHKNTYQLVYDPVNVTTGSFYVDHTDLTIAGALPIKLRRTYSGRDSSFNELGFGWVLGYPSYIVLSYDGSTLQAADSDGSVVLFRTQGNPDVWLAQTADNPELENNAGAEGNLLNSSITRSVSAGVTTYQWKLANGSVRNYILRQFPIQVGALYYARERPYLDTWLDNRGNLLKFTFDPTTTANSYGKITQIQSSNGTSLAFTYDSTGRITRGTAGDGRTVNYTYTDPAGDLTSVQGPDGQICSYQYGTSGLSHYILKETNPDNRVLTNSYDGLGRVTLQTVNYTTHGQFGDSTAPVQNAVYDYSITGQTTVKDAFNNPTIYRYTDHLITQVIDALGRTTTKSYYTALDTPNGAYPRSLQSVTDARGLVTTFRYDAYGDIVQTLMTGDLEGDGVVTHTSISTAVFDSLHRPTSTTNASGIATVFTYADAAYPYLPTLVTTSKAGTLLRTDKMEYAAKLDLINPTTLFSKGLLGRKTIALGSSDQAIVEYDYNTAGLVTKEKAYTGTSDPDVLSTFTYNARGELASSTDGDGRSTFYTYDGMSRPLTKVVKGESGTVVATWTTTYTANGEVASIVGPHTNPATQTQNTYDPSGLIYTAVESQSQGKSDGTGVGTATATRTVYIHDKFGNLTSVKKPNGFTTIFTYDAMGEVLTKWTDQFSTETFQYEAGGSVSQLTNPLGGISRSYYTTTGKIRRRENADGSVEEWRYYDDGRIQKEKLRNGSYWETTYDDVAHRVTRTFKNVGGTVLATEVSESDLRGNVIRHTDGEGYVKTTSYDDLDRVKTVSGPAGITGSALQSSATSYGASSKNLSFRNGLNEETVTTSDVLGRPLSVQTKAADGTVIRLTTSVYSVDHNSVVVTRGSGQGAVVSTLYSDTKDRTVLTIDSLGKFTRNVYDLNGNLGSVVDALNQAVGYGHTTLDLIQITTYPDGTAVKTYQNEMGAETQRIMPGDTLTLTHTYDTANRVLTEKLTAGSLVTRQFSYGYYPASSPFAGLLQTVTGPRTTTTVTYDDFLRPLARTTTGVLPELNSSTTYSYDRRNMVTAIDQSSPGDAAGPATHISRTYDGYGQLTSELITVSGTAHSSIVQTWDAAGRRTSVHETGATPTAPLFAYQYRADGALTQVAANGENYGFTYGDNGLLTTKTNPFRMLSVDSRDPAGRVLQETTSVGGMSAMVENMTWRGDSTLASYAVNRSGSGAWSESRGYSYSNRGRLLSEGVSLAPGKSDVLNFTFDAGISQYGVRYGLGIRQDAKLGSAPTISWESAATNIDILGRVTAEQNSELAHIVPASGVALGADHVDLLVDGVSQGRATHPGWADAVGAWTANLSLQPGAHTFTANAVHPSNQYTATSTSTLTVASDGTGGTMADAFDNEGNVTSRTWASGRVQTLTWDAFNRLVKVSDRDSTNNGSDWTAAYDALGRRLRTIQQAVVSGVTSGAVTTAASLYDPNVEFLEIGVVVNGVKVWKVYGLDQNDLFGGLQGAGGLEATVVDASGTTRGILNDEFGNDVGAIAGGAVSWAATRVGSYGPLPGSHAETLTDANRLAEATTWRGRRVDATGLVYLGARYYEPTSGRFLSTDPAGHTASVSLYDYANGDPVNFCDPNGRLASKVKAEVAAGNYADAQKHYTILKTFLSQVERFNAQNSQMTLGDQVRMMLSVSNGFAPNPLNGVIDKAIAVGQMTDSPWTGAMSVLNPVYGVLEGGYENVTGRSLNPDTPQRELGFWERVLSGVSAELNVASAFGVGSVGSKLLAPGLTRLLSTTETEMVTVFRGVHANHPALAEALEGRATPMGGHSDPALHNAFNNRSIFTSWTTDEATAVGFATEQGPGGVVLKQTVPRSMLISSPDAYKEFEVLRMGPVTNATPKILSK